MDRGAKSTELGEDGGVPEEFAKGRTAGKKERIQGIVSTGPGQDQRGHQVRGCRKDRKEAPDRVVVLEAMGVDVTDTENVDAICDNALFLQVISS